MWSFEYDDDQHTLQRSLERQYLRSAAVTVATAAASLQSLQEVV